MTRPKKRINYEEHRHVAESRGGDKRVKGPDGKVHVMRGYGLPEKKLASLLQEWHETGVLPSPFKKSIYGYQFTALVELGVNQAHSIAEIKRKLREIMGDEWIRFEQKPSRSAGENEKDATGRLLENYKAFRRLCKNGGANPMGFKVKQLGCAVEFFRDSHGVKYVRLNTHLEVPPNLKRVKTRDDIPPVNFSAPTKGPRK